MATPSTSLTNLSKESEELLKSLEGEVKKAKYDLDREFTEFHQCLDVKHNALSQEIDNRLRSFRVKLAERDLNRNTLLKKKYDKQVSGKELQIIEEKLIEIDDTLLSPPTVRVKIHFSYFQRSLEHCCRISGDSTHYIDKTKPFWSLGSSAEGSGKLSNPYGLSIDLSLEDIIIADCRSNRVLIFSKLGDIKMTITNELMKCPYSVIVDTNYYYISCSVRGGHLLKIAKCSYVLENHAYPNHIHHGITFDCSGFIYGLVLNKKVVIIYNKQFEPVDNIFLETPYFEQGHTAAEGIVLMGTEIFILFDKSEYRLQAFSSSGQLLRRILTSNAVVGAVFFCMDTFFNFIVSDYCGDKVVVFSSKGEFITNLGKKGIGSGQIYRPCGIAIDNDMRVVVVDRKEFHNIQIFCYLD